MSSKALIELRNVAVRRKGRIILDLKALDIFPQEHVAIIGANGAGKSTLVQVLSQEVHPLWHPQLKRTLFGKDRWHIVKLRSHLGIVSESMQNLCHTNYPVIDIVLSAYFSAIGLDFHHQVRPEMIGAAEQALKNHQIYHLRDKPMKSLSSGEAKRTLLARASLLDPQVYLLDEAVANLDFPAKKDFRTSLQAIDQRGKTLIIVTHDLTDIITEIQRVVVLKEGKLLADGPKESILTEEILSEAYNTKVFVSTREGRYTAWC